MSSNRFLKVLRLLLIFFAIPFLAIIVVRNWQELSLVTQTPLPSIGLIIAVSLVAMWVNSFRLKIINAMYSISLGVGEAFQLSSANAFYNIITPMKGGIAVKGLYLHQVKNMPWPQYTASLVISQLLVVSVSLCLALSVIAIYGLLSPIVVYSLILLIAIGCYLLFTHAELFQTPIPKRIAARFNLEQLLLPAMAPKHLLIYSSIQIIFLLCISCRLYLVFSLFVPDIQLWQIIIIQSIVTCSLFISMTPGNIGIQEGLVAIAGAYFAIHPESAVLASLLERAFVLLTILPVGGLSSVFIMRKIREQADFSI